MRLITRPAFLTLAVPLLAYTMVSSLLSGRPALALTVLAGVGAWFIVTHVVAGTLVTVALVTVVDVRFLPIEVGGVRTDLPELLMLACVGGWAARAAVGFQRTPRRLAFAVGLIIGGAALGAAVSLSAGVEFTPVLGEFKAFAFYMLLLPLAASTRTIEDQESLQDWIVRISLVGSAVIVGLAASGNAPDKYTAQEVVTGALVSEAQRLRAPILQLAFLATLLILARAAQRGTRPSDVVHLAVLLSAQALGFYRSMWVPLVLVTVLFIRYRPGERTRLRGARGTLTALVLLTVVYVGADAGVLGSTADGVATRARSVLSPEVLDESSLHDRLDENAVAVDAIAASPLTGAGLGRPFGLRRSTFDLDLNRRVARDHPRVHNSLLLAWVKGGIVTVAGLVALGLWVRRRTKHLLRSLPPGAGARSLVAGLAVLGFAMQSLFHAYVITRSTIATLACAVGLLCVEPAAQQVKAEAAAQAVGTLTPAL